MSQPSLSIVVPAYNEERRLEKSLDQIAAYFRSREFPFEIIVVDDGSTDQTYQVACARADLDRQTTIRVLRNSRNRGKGYSVCAGVLESRAHYALLTDADLSTPIQEFPKLERRVIQGSAAIALGSRDLEESKVEIHQSKFRETAGKVFNRLVRWLTGLPFRDTQCGFKLYSLPQCREIFQRQRLHQYAFDVEVLFIAQKWGFNLEEVPVVWRHASGSKVSILRDSIRTLLDLLRIRWYDFRGIYDRST